MPSQLERNGQGATITNITSGLRTTVDISLPGENDAAELWTITVENQANTTRSIKVVPYLEWVLNRPEADRGHTQYNRLFAEMEYAKDLHAVLAFDKHAKIMGVLASDHAPEGFLTSRIDFIGRARSLGMPRGLETLAFAEPRDTAAHPTLDPIGSLLIGVTIPARGLSRIRLLMGFASGKEQARELVARHLQVGGPSSTILPIERGSFHPIGHGEIPSAVTQPYTEFAEDGRQLVVRTPFTPRPFDHTMSNALGHVTVVTNRGPHTSSSVNSQQNRLTPDWSDIVTREVPGEAFYLYDPAEGEWYSPTYHPLNNANASHGARFGVDGTATFHMVQGTLETELTVAVPPEDPVGIYLMTIRNRADTVRRLRLAPYFQIVLTGQPEHAGPLRIWRDPSLPALSLRIRAIRSVQDRPSWACPSGLTLWKHGEAGSSEPTGVSRILGWWNPVSLAPDGPWTIDRSLHCLPRWKSRPAANARWLSFWDKLMIGIRQRRSSPSTRMSSPHRLPLKRRGSGGSAS